MWILLWRYGLRDGFLARALEVSSGRRRSAAAVIVEKGPQTLPSLLELVVVGEVVDVGRFAACLEVFVEEAVASMMTATSSSSSWGRLSPIMIPKVSTLPVLSRARLTDVSSGRGSKPLTIVPSASWSAAVRKSGRVPQSDGRPSVGVADVDGPSADGDDPASVPALPHAVSRHAAAHARTSWRSLPGGIECTTGL